MTRGRRQIAAALCAAVALAAAGCGSDGPDGEPLPPRIQDELDPRLTSIAQRVANGSPGACDDIYASRSAGGDFEPIDETLAEVPERVDADVRAALEQSIDRLKQLVDDACDEIRGTADDEGPAADEPVTDEAPPDTTEEAPPETTETAPETTETAPQDTPTTPTGDTGDETGGGTGGGTGGNGGTGGDTGGGTGGTGGTGGGPGQGGGPTGNGPPGQGGGLEAPE